MELIQKYVDVYTGKDLAYVYQNGLYYVAVSKDFAVSKNMPDADILEYMEVDIVDEAVSNGGSEIYRVDRATYKLEDDVWRCLWRPDGSRDVELYYHCSRDEIMVKDYIFNKIDRLILDDDTAYERCRTGVDM